MNEDLLTVDYAACTVHKNEIEYAENSSWSNNIHLIEIHSMVARCRMDVIQPWPHSVDFVRDTLS